MSMKYITPDLIKRMNAPGIKVITAALEEWEVRMAAYERRLKRIWPKLPRAVRHYLDTCRLHDAGFVGAFQSPSPNLRNRRSDGTRRVSLLARQADQLVVLTFDGVSRFDKKVVLEPGLSSEQPLWLYDEFDVRRGGELEYSVLLSTGEELTIRFRKFQVIEGSWLLPAEEKRLKAVS